MIHDQPIDSLPTTSILTIRRLKSLGIQTYWDLLNFFPFRYEDYSMISKVNRLQAGEIVTVIGQIIDSKYQVTRTDLRIQKFTLQDETGTMELNWYNQPYLLTLFKKGVNVSVAGEVRRFGRKLVVDPKEYELIYSNYSNNWSSLKHTGRIIPIYPEKRGLSSKTIREKIFYIFTYLQRPLSIGTVIEEILPREIIHSNNLIDEEDAYRNIHFPETKELQQKARERLSFDELLITQLSSKLIKKEWEKETVGNPFKMTREMRENLDHFIKHLPFTLTNAQLTVIREIQEDLKKITPMNRFLQGEVGSGKTVVAAIACYIAYLNGFQSLFMAPTEILAEQHYQTLKFLFGSFQFPMDSTTLTIGLSEVERPISNFQTSDKSPITNNQLPKICLITGSSKPRKNYLDMADIIIGTHALIQKKIVYKKVGLVIVDEQHRFGVQQRAMLKEKGLNPHLLTMTATPIPRTVALTLFGELDISIIDEMPKDRKPIKTFFIPKSKRSDCYEWVKRQITKLGIQVFIICPLIEESEIETMKSVKAAKKEVEFLQANIFPEYRVGLIHGKMKSKEKEEAMNEFKNKKYHILVATPVVEVGIDIPNATIMLIEASERFGLAQLHQLRGRIGRGDKQSYCFLFTEKESPEITRRLQFVANTHNGSVLAEKDLELRGAGTIYGTKQHGIVELKIASLSDYPMIEKTRKAVEYFMEHYDTSDFEELKKRVEKLKVGQIAKD